MKHILLIEDEHNVASFIKKGLEEEGYEVSVAFEGQTGMQLLFQHAFDLVILDVILPGQNGFDLCREIRKSQHGHLPIILLTALSTTDSIVKGLDAGADDYLPKPFKFKELLARIRAQLRRGEMIPKTEEKIVIAGLELNTEAKTVKRDNREIRLTSTEYRLLEYFMRNRNKVLSRIDILENVWSINFNMGTNVVDVYVNYLRNKIDSGFEPKLIQTVVGMGYIMKEPVLS